MVDKQVYERVMCESREKEEWDRMSFERWWTLYRARHPEDSYPEDAPKEVRQAFTAALVLLREKLERGR